MLLKRWLPLVASRSNRLSDGLTGLPSKSPASPRVLSLFTGVGGLDLGLEAAGCSFVGSVESASKAREALRRNRPAWLQLTPHDVCEAASLLPQYLGLAAKDLDIIAAGPPCQPFSKAAQWTASGRKGMADGRAGAISAMLDLVESFLPRVIFIENVVGFTQGRESAMSEIQRRLLFINLRHRTKYRATWTVVDCASYGIPQHRRRALIVISREGVAFKFPSPTHADKPLTAWDAIGEIDPGSIPKPNGRWAEILPCIPEGGNYQWLTARGGGQEIFGYRTRYWSFLLKLAKDRPSWTIPASPGPSTGPFHWENRPLSITELLRLQSFPLDWRVAGSRRDQVRLIGNATPPLLSEIVGREILTQLLGRPAIFDPPTLGISRASGPTPPPSAPRNLPDTFHFLVGPKLPHAGAGRGPAARQG
jgi:DNA (cytosine-5)-methyltransferase 1